MASGESTGEWISDLDLGTGKIKLMNAGTGGV